MSLERVRFPDSVGANWSHCPGCGTHQIEGTSVDIVGNEAAQEMGCLICGADWVEVYTASYREMDRETWPPYRPPLEVV